MVRIIRVSVLALVVAGMLLVAGCGTTPSPTPSPASPSPLAQLGELAYRYRSDSGPTKAWSVELPASEASQVVREDLVGEAVDSPSASVYLVILKGAYSLSDGRTRTWAVLYPRADAVPQGEAAVLLKKRPATPGRAWTALDLAAPQ